MPQSNTSPKMEDVKLSDADVKDSKTDDRDAEIARLREENAKLRERGDAVPLEPEEKSDSDEDNTPMIVHRQYTTDEKGQPKVIEHGPMPVADWAEYERKNNL